MQPAIADRQIGRLAQHLLRLHSVTIAHGNPRADCAAVRLDAGQLDLDPVMAAGYVVAQQGRRLVLIDDEDVHVPVVVEVAEGATAAGVAGGATQAPPLLSTPPIRLAPASRRPTP